MSTTLRFEPIAAQLGKTIRISDVLPSDALDETRNLRGLEHDPSLPDLPAHTEEFLLHHFALVRAAQLLLETPPFERLWRLSDDIVEEFAPDEPPESPVNDSFATLLVLSDVPHPLADETPYSVLAHLTRGDSARRDFHELASAVAASHCDLYSVTRADAGSLSAELVALRSGESREVELVDPFLRSGDLLLTRLVAFRGRLYVSDSPYLLLASQEEWLAHLERIASHQQPQSAASRAPTQRGKLSSKEAARRRKQERARAERISPEQRIRRHLKYGRSERYWLEYISEAYAGERDGLAYLAGVPDRPELLPRSADYDPAQAAAAAGTTDLVDSESEHALARLRRRLIRIGDREGHFARAQREFLSACSEAGISSHALEPNELPLFASYCMLGVRSARGQTALALYAHEPQAKSDPEAQAFVRDIERGWFSAFRVDRIHLDESLETFDILRKRQVSITERAATRELAIGDIVLGWVLEDGRGVLTLEGNICGVPAMLAAPFSATAEQLYDRALRAAKGDEGPDAWRTATTSIVVPLLVAVRTLDANPPLPELVNTHGEPLNMVTARYQVIDHAAALASLTAAFGSGDETGAGTDAEASFVWLEGPSETVIAHIELSAKALRVRVNSIERLERVKARLTELLGDHVRPSFDAFERDVSETVRERLAQRASAPYAKDVDTAELPPEVLPQLHAMVMQQIRTNFDQPIPRFRNKTLRQVARSQRTRADAVSWLREQERMLKHNPQMAGLDMRPLWQELGLEYQGLDTDPR